MLGLDINGVIFSSYELSINISMTEVILLYKVYKKYIISNAQKCHNG